MPAEVIRLPDGLFSNDAPGHIPPTGLQSARGARYKPDSPGLDKAQGRASFNSAAPGSGRSSLVALDFKAASANDILVMQQGASLFSETVGTTGSFSELIEQKEQTADADVTLGMTASTDALTAVQLEDAWIICNGASRPILIENNGLGRELGLNTPQGQITLSNPNFAGTVTRAQSATNVFTTIPGNFAAFAARVNGTDSKDADFDTATSPASEGSVLPEDTAASIAVWSDNPRNALTVSAVQRTYSWAGAGSSVKKWDFEAVVSGKVISTFPHGSPVQNVLPYSVRYLIEVSVDSGDTFTALDIGSLPRGKTTFTLPINAGVAVDRENIRVRLTVSGSGYGSASLEIFDVVITDGAASNQFSTTGAGIRYAYALVRKYTRILPGSTFAVPIVTVSSISPLSPPVSSPPLTFTNWWGIKGVLTNITDTDSNATHVWIFRSKDEATDDETKDWSVFSRIKEFPVSQTSFVDRINDDGHPLDFQDPQLAPPFLKVLGFLQESNTPPPQRTDVVGVYKGSVLYAGPDQPGVFFWSRPLQPDLVPAIYSDVVPSRVTAFEDIGVLLVFTPQSVTVYSSLLLAGDTDFSPFREAEEISSSRGCVSRTGSIVIDIPGQEKRAAFVAGDGLYTANAGRVYSFSPMLDWPATVSVSSLSTSELWHDASERRLILAYTDENGDRQALDFYYSRAGIGRAPIAVTGPRPWPSEGTAPIFRNNQMDVYTIQKGFVFLEKTGDTDAAKLESSSGTITFDVTTKQFYPWGVDGEGRIMSVLIDTPALANSTIDVTLNTRFDDRPNDAKAYGPHTVKLDNAGFKELVIEDADSQLCESFNINLRATSPIPTISALAVKSDPTSDEGTLRPGQ